MKILISGAGEVGNHLATLFCNEDHDVILMDESPAKLRKAEDHLDLITVVGSGTSIDDLKNAQVKSCDLFIAVPPYEEVSILSAMLAKKLGAAKTIARINNFEYLQSENKEYFRQLGVDEVIFPEHLGAREIMASLKQVGIRQMFEFSDGRLLLYAVKIRNNAPIVGLSLSEASALHETNEYFTVAINRDGKTIIPRGKDTFQHNDLAYVVTTKSGAEQLLKDAGKIKYEVKNVMILGGSRIGKKVAKELEHEYYIKLIEIDRDKSNRLANMLENTLVINGDGRNLNLLKDEGIGKTDAFIAVTDNSEVNILACQLAKKMGVKKTVAEVENMDYIDLAENIGIGTIINKKLIAASYIYRYTFKANVSYVKCLTATDADVLELIAQEGSKITKATLKDLDLPKDMNIGGVIRNGEAIIPNGATRILPDDRVVVFALPSGIKKVERMFL
ncbi:Trk system potassium transporter TrkA [Alkalitalea saponilacus]|uniref:Trk system potassium uptake protein TrkA n=1 Tax=Alkalitalea saponilacus TaxID=889453 RepID=A0A1T5GLY9_9BACT|nr:Trk system potassium transporter TrkA [Alkalitalea saponilacus]ASB48281.1 Trk system potassium transport protein TrkA [Alkalitalea saponilacus]SKC09423.1 trk system potassium uptake protein TrkA [Alkalitalea saponilacus]